MKHKSNLFLLTSFLAIFLSGAAFAQSGEATYKQVCMSCHGAGVLNAPKFGDKAKWAPLNYLHIRIIKNVTKQVKTLKINLS